MSRFAKAVLFAALTLGVVGSSPVIFAGDTSQRPRAGSATSGNPVCCSSLK